MKLHADKPDVQSITAYGDDWVAVDGKVAFEYQTRAFVGTLN